MWAKGERCGVKKEKEEKDMGRRQEGNKKRQ
jgi:hypothetical protein